MYTTHGHHIASTPKGPVPTSMVMCGGPKKCDACFGEALAENTRKQTEEAGGSMFMSPYQMRQVAEKMRTNNPTPGGVTTRSEVLLHRTLFEFAKALDDVANDIEKPPVDFKDWNVTRIRPRQ